MVSDGMADGHGGWAWQIGAARWPGTILLSRRYLETIWEPKLAGLGWQGWSKPVQSGWAGLGQAELDF